MNGRQERDYSIKTYIERVLREQPEILEDYFYGRQERSLASMRQYLNRLVAFIEYAESTLGIDPNNPAEFGKLKLKDFNAYIASISYKKEITKDNRERVVKKKETTIANNIFAIKDFYSFLEDNGDIRTNPTTKISIPKAEDRREVIYLENDEIDMMKERICDPFTENNGRKVDHDKWKHRDLAILTLGCKTGLRVSAISGINMEDLHLSEGSISVVEKGNVNKEVYVGEETIKYLRTWIKVRENLLDGTEVDALFISKRRTRISVRHIERIIKEAAMDVPKKITPHKMRSTCAVNLYEKTHDVYLVKEVLGHQNIQNTERYTGVSKKMKKEAAKILDQI